MEQSTEITLSYKNEVLARFLGWEKYGDGYKSTIAGWTTFAFTSFARFDLLMPVWYKFRDLHIQIEARHFDKYSFLCNSIGNAILNQGISEAFKELVSGITWYNSIKS